MVNISFAWDDGSSEDLKLMDLCLHYSIPAIFFIPVTNPERAVISKSEVKVIESNGFEIGAHTYSHSYLTLIKPKDADIELVSGRDFYEQILGKEIQHFCFPGGKYNNELVEMVKSYFKTARTADTGALIRKNAFLIKPTFHFFNRGKKSLIYNSFKNSSVINYLTIRNIISKGYFNYLKNIITDLSDYPETYRIIIWGHSWEIEQFSLWNDLDDFFQWITKNYSSDVRSYSEILNSTRDSSI
jgi:peptidoglycan/xylan/chitin deacetylase (PgdA/CDA1 family)